MIRFLVAIASAVLLAACSDGPEPETRNNKVVSEKVNAVDSSELQRMGIKYIEVSCALAQAVNVDRKLVVIYGFTYGKRVIYLDTVCNTKSKSLIDLYWWSGTRYAPAQYQVDTSEAYSYEVVKKYMDVVYQDIKTNASAI